MTTTIGKHRIPVRFDKQCAVYQFTGGPRRGDAGTYAFWVAIFKRPALDGRYNSIIRSRVGLSVGERFERLRVEGKSRRFPLAARKANLALWADIGGGSNIRYIRPAHLLEIEHWMVTHADDADRGVPLEAEP